LFFVPLSFRQWGGGAWDAEEWESARFAAGRAVRLLRRARHRTVPAATHRWRTQAPDLLPPAQCRQALGGCASLSATTASTCGFQGASKRVRLRLSPDSNMFVPGEGQSLLALAQSTAMARAMARICNEERVCLGVTSGHDRKTLSLSAAFACRKRLGACWRTGRHLHESLRHGLSGLAVPGAVATSCAKAPGSTGLTRWRSKPALRAAATSSGWP